MRVVTCSSVAFHGQELTSFASGRCRAFVADVCSPMALRSELQDATVDLVTLIFVLSAIPPARVEAALANLLRVLRPGGQLLFRDYGLYDLAQLRQPPGSTLGTNYYARADGTLARFFERDELRGWFESVGFITLDASYATVTNMRAWPSRASTPIATLRPLLQGASESISANAFAKVLVAWPSSGHRKTGVAMKRVWLQATFQKPA